MNDKSRKAEREGEAKGRAMLLIRKPRQLYWTAADDHEVYVEKNTERHRDMLAAFRYRPLSVWPDEAFLAFHWLIEHEEIIALLQL